MVDGTRSSYAATYEGHVKIVNVKIMNSVNTIVSTIMNTIIIERTEADVD